MSSSDDSDRSAPLAADCPWRSDGRHLTLDNMQTTRQVLSSLLLACPRRSLLTKCRTPVDNVDNQTGFPAMYYITSLLCLSFVSLAIPYC